MGLSLAPGSLGRESGLADEALSFTAMFYVVCCMCMIYDIPVTGRNSCIGCINRRNRTGYNYDTEEYFSILEAMFNEL